MLATVQAKDACCDKSSYHKREMLTEKQRSYEKEFYSLLVTFFGEQSGLSNTGSCPMATKVSEAQEQ